MQLLRPLATAAAENAPFPSNNHPQDGDVAGLEGGRQGEGEKGATERFGIISTADVWDPILTTAVREAILGPSVAERVFKGVETCGIDAGKLHGHGEVEERVKDAARRLVDGEGRGGVGGEGEEKGRVGVVVLGCAGMVGMEEWVRGVAGPEVRVVEGVRAGVGVLQGLCRGGF